MINNKFKKRRKYFTEKFDRLTKNKNIPLRKKNLLRKKLLYEARRKYP